MILFLNMYAMAHQSNRFNITCICNHISTRWASNNYLQSQGVRMQDSLGWAGKLEELQSPARVHLRKLKSLPWSLGNWRQTAKGNGSDQSSS